MNEGIFMINKIIISAAVTTVVFPLPPSIHLISLFIHSPSHPSIPHLYHIPSSILDLIQYLFHSFSHPSLIFHSLSLPNPSHISLSSSSSIQSFIPPSSLSFILPLLIHPPIPSHSLISLLIHLTTHQISFILPLLIYPSITSIIHSVAHPSS